MCWSVLSWRLEEKSLLFSEVLSPRSSLFLFLYCANSSHPLNLTMFSVCSSHRYHLVPLGFFQTGKSLKTASWGKYPVHLICFPSFMTLLWCLFSNIWTSLFDILEKEMATHSSVLAWRIPGMGAWWAAVYGVTQSWTPLKWLSSSSIHIHAFRFSASVCIAH